MTSQNTSFHLGPRAWCKCPGSFPKHEHQDGKLQKLAKENYSIVLFTYILWSFNVGESTIHGSLVISLGTIQWRRCRYIGLFSSLTSDPHPPILPTPAAANKQLLTEPKEHKMKSCNWIFPREYANSPKSSKDSFNGWVKQNFDTHTHTTHISRQNFSETCLFVASTIHVRASLTFRSWSFTAILPLNSYRPSQKESHGNLS